MLDSVQKQRIPFRYNHYNHVLHVQSQMQPLEIYQLTFLKLQLFHFQMDAHNYLDKFVRTPFYHYPA